MFDLATLYVPECAALPLWPFNKYFSFPQQQKQLEWMKILFSRTTLPFYVIYNFAYAVFRTEETCRLLQ